ncbi:MAG TPA: 50S ribosomal protein L30 [Candidatus Adamsella sp.]|nr:50S ribosomal protein L30 [Candidatus Adamsella sp.]
MAEKLKIKLTKSLIGASAKQKKVVKALGLTKLNQVVEHENTDVIKGMINAIPHMVCVE